jgi:hypothetical protein
LDESIAPGVAFPQDYVHDADELQPTTNKAETSDEVEKSLAPAFLAFGKESVGGRKPLFIGAAAVAVLASVAVIGVPAGWYSAKNPAAAATTETVTQPAAPQTAQADTPVQPQPTSGEAAPANEDAAAALKRQREKERRAREAKAAENPAAVASAPSAPAAETKPGAKRVVVTVTYDESGRVTQASGGDANALRIARQKRFPAGKAGSATISIPIN